MFINDLKSTLDNEFNYSRTENGAIGFRTTGKALLDLNFAVSSLRSASESQIINMFMKAFYEDKLVAMKWLFYARDARQGLGERKLFRVIIEYLCRNNPEVVEHLLKYVGEYGRYDDLLCVVGTQHTDIVIKIFQKQLLEDKANMLAGKPISLLAKWLPSPNTSSRETVAKARSLIKLFETTEARYRKLLSKMRKYIDVVEVKMSAKQWEEINYEAVPSRANLLYNKAFLRNDESRRKQYLEDLEKGEAKINASVLFPHDIVHKYRASSYTLTNTDVALEAMWKSLPNTVRGNGNTIVVADGSGSMTVGVSGTSVTALSVANSLAIYFAERSTGEFKDKYITFSSKPQLVDFSQCASLREKIEVALRHNEVSNTNIEAVFDLVLVTAVKKGLKQSDIPQNILIVSDMEFDNATTNRATTRLFESIASKYNSCGYKLPRLIFWNVCSRTGTIPVKENDFGVALVSGFSPNIVRMVISGELDPYQCLLSELMSERYAQITI